mgnify:CR=1 FL=1
MVFLYVFAIEREETVVNASDAITEKTKKQLNLFFIKNLRFI